MTRDLKLIESTKPSYEVLKWIGGGGFGQVYKVLRNNRIVACKQVLTIDPHLALAEHRNMTAVKGGPYIATVHDDAEWNPKTKTLSFFMDYYKGKDLDRLVHKLRASGEHFTETQVLDIACQVAMALEFCHEKKLLHQDIKPMNVLLKEQWNPLSEPTVPELYVSDFGIASRVKTIGTRFTAQRGTPPYEAPEIRGKGHYAEFSQKSDTYALGCILYRLCTLDEPDEAAGIQPHEIPADYSVELLTLISSMLSYDRTDRPTATEVKQTLLALIQRYFNPQSKECYRCRQLFPTQIELRQHLKETGHNQAKPTPVFIKEESVTPQVNHVPRLKIKNAAPKSLAERITITPKSLADRVTFGAREVEVEEEEEEKTPCAVCWKQPNSRRGFFKHLQCAHHYRDPRFVLQRFYDADPDFIPKNKKRRRA